MPKTITLSSSSIRTFMSCRRKYWFQYVEKLQPITRPSPLSMGSAIHAGLQYLFDNGSGKVVDREELKKAVYGTYTADEIDEAGTDPLVAVEAVLAFDRAVDWRGKWQFHRVEPLFDVSIGHGRRAHGFFDGIVTVGGSMYVLENKSVAGMVQERRLHHLLWDTQAGLYIAAGWELDLPIIGSLYNFIPKPTIEQGKATPVEERKYTKEKRDKAGNVTEPSRLYANQRERDETNEEFLERVRGWYAERLTPEYFRQHIVTRNKAQVESLLENLKKLAKDMRACERDGSYYMNPDACSTLPCPYASVCLEDTPFVREANFAKRENKRSFDNPMRTLEDL